MNVLSQMNDQIGDLDAEIQKKEEIEGKKKLPVKEQLELFQLRKFKRDRGETGGQVAGGVYQEGSHRIVAGQGSFGKGGETDWKARAKQAP